MINLRPRYSWRSLCLIVVSKTSSGLGYIVGSEASRVMGSWHWGLRVTPWFCWSSRILHAANLKAPIFQPRVGGTTLNHSAKSQSRLIFNYGLVWVCRLISVFTFSFYLSRQQKLCDVHSSLHSGGLRRWSSGMVGTQVYRIGFGHSTRSPGCFIGWVRQLPS
jgi:hypothetical protein